MDLSAVNWMAVVIAAVANFGYMAVSFVVMGLIIGA